MQSTGKDPIEGSAALDLLDGVKDLYVAKGKRSLHVDLASDRPSDDELLGLTLGRSGKLRAPAMRSGDRFIVGCVGDVRGVGAVWAFVGCGDFLCCGELCCDGVGGVEHKFHCGERCYPDDRCRVD